MERRAPQQGDTSIRSRLRARMHSVDAGAESAQAPHRRVSHQPLAMDSLEVYDILIVGEALIDRIATAAGTDDRPGGSPMNVAYGLARLGCTVGFLTSIGDDLQGKLILEHLASAGARLLPGSVTRGRTSTAVATLDTNGSASYHFDIRWRLSSDVPPIPTPMVHAGSIGAMLEPGAESVHKIVRASQKSALISFDPNIRPSLLPSPDLARARFQQFASLSDVVKLSEQDAAWLYPGTPPNEVLERVLALGPALAVVTCGADGAVLASAESAVRIPSMAVTAVDSIGAGDAYMSALLFQLHRLLQVEGLAILRTGSVYSSAELTLIGEFASMCAAISVTRPGADPPTTAELVELQERFGWSHRTSGRPDGDQPV